MTVHTFDDSQRTAARVVGLGDLIAMATSIFAEAFVRGTLVDYGNALAPTSVPAPR
ncbi:MAG: hypothetical protein ACREOU_12880 [Candidatus Eiseniibacteriota bacterium]